MRKKIEKLMAEYKFEYEGNYANFQLQTILLLYAKTVSTILLVTGLPQKVDEKTYAVHFVLDKHSKKLFEIKFSVIGGENADTLFEKTYHSLEQLKVKLEETKPRLRNI